MKRPAPVMTFAPFLLCAFLALAGNALAAEWKLAGEAHGQDTAPGLLYVQRSAVRLSDGRQVTAHLAFFASRTFRLEVVDLGAGPEASYPTMRETRART